MGWCAANAYSLLVRGGRRGCNVCPSLRHGEDQAAFTENRDRASGRTPGDAELLDQLQLTRDGPIRRPLATLYPLGEYLDKLKVDRYWPVRLDHESQAKRTRSGEYS